jgi:hypothetical protein
VATSGQQQLCFRPPCATERIAGRSATAITCSEGLCDGLLVQMGCVTVHPTGLSSLVPLVLWRWHWTPGMYGICWHAVPGPFMSYDQPGFSQNCDSIWGQGHDLRVGYEL